MTLYDKNTILDKMKLELNDAQLLKLSNCLNELIDEIKTTPSNKVILDLFITAKTVEGCSKKSIKYYLYILNSFFAKFDKSVKNISTDDIRNYLDIYFKNSSISKTSIDNIRRVISTFFSWLEEEDYIRKNPVKRIHKIKTLKSVKQAYTDENIENLKDSCNSLRDKVIIELLASTGIRVGELVLLNKDSIDFENKQCIVLGKGNKQRQVYFDSKTKIHLLNYLNSRIDDNNALFVSLFKPFNRLQISGVEIMLRKLGAKTSISKVHPHRFRRTLATKAISKGMPVEQVQILLGHTKIDTTMHYAIVDQSNVQLSYRKFIG